MLAQLLVAALATATPGPAPAAPLATAAPAPSPDLLELSRLSLPRPLVEGVVDGLSEEAIPRALSGHALAPEREASLRTRAREVVEAAARRALPEDALVAFGADLLARSYAPAERTALLAWHRSELARRLEAFRIEARRIDARLAPDTAAAEREKAALAGRTFQPDEPDRIAAFAATPTGQKAARLVPELTSAWLDFLVRRIEAERPALEAALRDLVTAEADPGRPPSHP